MMKKLSMQISKIPVSVLMIILVGIGLLSGSCTARVNLLESELIKGFDKELLTSLGVMCICIISIDLCLKVFNKALRNKVINDTYLKKLDQVSKSKMSDINKLTSGKIFGLTQESAQLRAGLITSFVWLATAIPPFMTLMVKEFQYDKRMMFISVSSLLVTTVMVLLSDKLFGWSTEGQRKKSALSGVTADNFSNIRTIKSLKQTGFARRRLVQAQKDLTPYAINIPHLMYFRLVDVLCITPLFINIILAKNNLVLLAFVVVSDYTMNQVRHIVADICDISVELKAAEKDLKILDGSDDEVYPIMTDTLVLNNVMFDYGNDDEIFKIDHLEFPFKSRTLVHGTSGSGKSSLANLITGCIETKIGRVPKYECYYIWQETESLADTLWNNIVFDNDLNIQEDEVLELFKKLDMSEWFCKLENGFDTFIGEKGCKLSSGQKQRLNIIRLILNMRYRKDYVFIIDEITSNLDAKTRELAIDLIDKECKSTLICISHNEGFDRICERDIEVTADHRFISK